MIVLVVAHYRSCYCTCCWRAASGMLKKTTINDEIVNVEAFSEAITLDAKDIWQTRQFTNGTKMTGTGVV